MIIKKLAISLLGLTCSLPVIAGTIGDVNPDLISSPFYVGAFGGYGTDDGGYKQDGDITQARLTIGAHLKNYKNIMFGGELGVQSGNTMRLNASPSVIEASTGLPIQSTLKPLIDALMTMKYQFQTGRPLFAVLKGGIAYRQLQLVDRTSEHDTLIRVNGEFQGGLGYNITEHVQLTAMYQGIYSANNAGVKLNRFDDITISQIPTQQAGFLGVEYAFF